MKAAHGRVVFSCSFIIIIIMVALDCSVMGLIIIIALDGTIIGLIIMVALDHSIMARKGVYCRFLFCRTYICTEVFVLPNGNKSGVSGTIVGKNHWFC